MSDLTGHCDGCGGHTSEVGAAFRDGDPCPYCGAPPSNLDRFEPASELPIVVDFADGTRIAGHLGPSVPVESREQPREAMWQVVVRIPERKRYVWGELIFDAVCEAVQGVTDGRRDFDPEIYGEPAGDADATMDRRLAAERDRARDLAAHLRGADHFEPPEDRNGWETIEKLRVAMDLNWGVSSSFPWPLVGFLLDEAEFAERTRAALAAHLEAEQAEERDE